MIRLLLVAFAVWCSWSSTAQAVQVADLDPEQEWHVKEMLFSGNAVFPEGELQAQILTHQRPWYTPWQQRPVFDLVTFATDLERLQRFYEAHGYYQAQVKYDLQIDEQDFLVTVQFQVEENQPFSVADAKITTPDYTPAPADAPLSEQLSVKPGAIFTEAAYQQGEQALRDVFLGRGHAWVKTRRTAKVYLARDQVSVRYTVQPGPQTVFGATQIEGARTVDSDLILRELTYQPGEQFSLRKISSSQEKIVGLGLFRAVQVLPERTAEGSQLVPMQVRLEEKPPRDTKIGLGYGTEDEFRGVAEWRHLNWFGGG